MNGGDGNDTLTGNDGSDTFVFTSAFGNDVITDFSKSEDTLEFYDAVGALINFSEITETRTDDGNSVLSLSDGSSVTLLGIDRYFPVEVKTSASNASEGGQKNKIFVDFLVQNWSQSTNSFAQNLSMILQSLLMRM